MVWRCLRTPQKNIKQSLAAFGIDVSKHNFLFPYLAVYDTEASLPDSTLQPADKWAKTCDDINGIPVKRVLKFISMLQLLSFSLCTNVPGCKTEFFTCRKSNTETDIKDLVEKFVGQLLAISEKNF